MTLRRRGRHESIQDIHVEMVANRFVQMGNVSLGNCDWNLLARFFWRLFSYSYHCGRGQFGVRRICVVEAITAGRWRLSSCRPVLFLKWGPNSSPGSERRSRVRKLLTRLLLIE